MNKLFPLTALALACVTSPLALANSKLEEIVVTSSRVPMPLRQIGTSVSVISGPEIQQRGFNSLFDVLRSQPAVAVSNSGGAGKQSTLRIRGEEGFRTKVYLDGIDTSDPSSPQISPQMQHLLSSGIERVEILRGPQGLMYGADAGGVVNISTRTTTEGFAGDISAEGGRYGSQQLAANLGGGNGDLDFNLSLADYETDGFNASTDDELLRDKDGYENNTVHARLGWNVTEALKLQVVARDVSAENEYDGCYTVDTFAFTHVCDNEFDQSSWRAVANYDAGAFSNELSYNASETERSDYSEGQPSFATDGEMERFSYVGSYSSGDSLRLVYGADLETVSIDDGSFDTERDQDGYFAEYQGGFGNSLFLTAGIRYDDNEDFGTHTSYRLSGAYLFDVASGELKLKGTYGTGFRAPSLYEIAYNGSFFAYPPASDTQLKEETSEGYDIGLSWYTDSGLVMEIVYFDQTVEDEIYFDLDSFSGYLQGDGDTESRGVELLGEIPLLESLMLSGNYTYNDTESSAGDTRIRRPEHLVNVGLNWRGLSDRLTLGLNLRGSYDAVDGDGTALDDYEVVDINASFDIFRGIQVFGRIENLLDEDYQEVPTFNTSGAAAYAGLRYSF